MSGNTSFCPKIWFEQMQAMGCEVRLQPNPVRKGEVDGGLGIAIFAPKGALNVNLPLDALQIPEQHSMIWEFLEAKEGCVRTARKDGRPNVSLSRNPSDVPIGPCSTATEACREEDAARIFRSEINSYLRSQMRVLQNPDVPRTVEGSSHADRQDHQLGQLRLD